VKKEFADFNLQGGEHSALLGRATKNGRNWERGESGHRSFSKLGATKSPQNSRKRLWEVGANLAPRKVGERGGGFWGFHRLTKSGKFITEV